MMTIEQDETQLAWAQAEVEDVAEYHGGAPRILAWAATLGAALTLFVMIWAAMHLLWPTSGRAVSSSVSATAATPEMISPPLNDDVRQQLSSAASAMPMDIDARFIALMQADGMEPTNSPSDLVKAAHLVCHYVAMGYTPSQIVNGVNASDTGITVSQKAYFVNLSIDIYCPA